MPDLKIGDRFAGQVGVLVVREVDGDRCRLSYAHDPDDDTWEDIADVLSTFQKVDDHA